MCKIRWSAAVSTPIQNGMIIFFITTFCDELTTRLMVESHLRKESSNSWLFDVTSFDCVNITKKKYNNNYNLNT